MCVPSNKCGCPCGRLTGVSVALVITLGILVLVQFGVEFTFVGGINNCRYQLLRNGNADGAQQIYSKPGANMYDPIENFYNATSSYIFDQAARDCFATATAGASVNSVMAHILAYFYLGFLLLYTIILMKNLFSPTDSYHRKKEDHCHFTVVTVISVLTLSLCGYGLMLSAQRQQIYCARTTVPGSKDLNTCLASVNNGIISNMSFFQIMMYFFIILFGVFSVMYVVRTPKSTRKASDKGLEMGKLNLGNENEEEEEEEKGKAKESRKGKEGGSAKRKEPERPEEKEKSEEQSKERKPKRKKVADQSEGGPEKSSEKSSTHSDDDDDTETDSKS